MHNFSGALVAALPWTGCVPDITFFDEKVGGLPDLFGTETVELVLVIFNHISQQRTTDIIFIHRPKEFSFPTRFDTEYLWRATESI